MIEAVVAAGWKSKHLAGMCLYNHAPSIQSCGWSGGVWDDRDFLVWPDLCGRCISADEAAKALAAEPDTEEVVVRAVNDGNITGKHACGAREEGVHVCMNSFWLAQ